jgi:hypothetical protein
MIQQVDKRIDWFRVITDLERKGYSRTVLAMAIDAKKSTVQGWKMGATPRYDDGDRLIELWCQVMGMGREGLPKRSRYDWRA